MAGAFQEEIGMEKTFYVTTPIYYPNGIPHVGTAYTTIAADILARWNRLKNGKAFLLTGTDEHGQKVEKAARAAGVEVSGHVDGIVAIFKEAWKRLDIQYDDFIRTTDSRHVNAVVKIFEALRSRGVIYQGHYEGWYCVSCETFWIESQLAEGNCPNPECGRPVELLKEEEYFFKLSAYQEGLLKHYAEHPDFVMPETRFNEMKSFVSRGLEDVCVSRKGLSWGIPVPGDPERSIYVWIDALTNYITAIDYMKDSKRFGEYWPADFHLIGKDILRFHAVTWPAMLMALGLPLPKTIFANGWLTMAGSKISKSRGEHKNLMELIDLYGPDPLRYFLMREAAFGEDLDFSEDGIIRRLNTDLANDLGNLVHRVLSMIHRYFNGKIQLYDPEKHSERLRNPDMKFYYLAKDLPNKLDECLTQLQFREGLMKIFELVTEGNRYVDMSAPWKLNKEGRIEELELVLHWLFRVIRVVSIALAAYLPQTAQQIWDQLGLPGGVHELRIQEFTFDRLESVTKIGEPRPLFQKVEVNVVS